MLRTDIKTLLIYGGSFDPPHVAHLALPMLAMEAAGADAVAFLPAAITPFKEDRRQTPVTHRLAMLHLATADANWAMVLTDEIDRAVDNRLSYTVDTLESLRAKWGPLPRLRLLIGADQVRLFHHWRQPARIIELAEPLVMLRPPETRASLLGALPADQREAWAVRIVAVPSWDISSTIIRDRIRARLPVSGMIHPAVEQYIAREGLYVEGGASHA